MGDWLYLICDILVDIIGICLIAGGINVMIEYRPFRVNWLIGFLLTCLGVLAIECMT